MSKVRNIDIKQENKSDIIWNSGRVEEISVRSAA